MTVDRTSRAPRRGRLLPVMCAVAAGLAGGCGGGPGAPGTRTGDEMRPVTLGRDRQPGIPSRASVLMPLDDALVRRGIENYRINKKRAKGPFTVAGADLNGDGVPEAVVLFHGKDWCAPTGCSLAILQRDRHGYKPISRTVRVKAPVVIATTQTNGWRDLFVSTGGAGTAPLRRVRLRFTGGGYNRNAMLEDELPPDVPQQGDVAIQAAPKAPG